MNFDSNRGPNRLRGASKREASKDELLKKVRAERKLRAETRVKNSCAEIVQRTFRGHACRKKLAINDFAKWVERFGPLAADPKAEISAHVVKGELLPIILQRALPPHSSIFRNVQKNGAMVTKSQIVEPTAVRGALALVLRSISSESPENNYCSLCGSTPKVSVEWENQCYRLLLLCSSILGSEDLSQDKLLQAAAARTLLLLIDQSKWKLQPTGDTGKECAERVALRLGASPAVFRGLQRLLQLNSEQTADGGVSQGQIVDWVAVVCIQLVQDHSRDSSEQWDSGPVRHFVRCLLTVPKLWELLRSHVKLARAEALEDGLMAQAFNFLHCLVQTEDLPPVHQLWALSNISCSIAGPRQKKQVESGPTIHFLLPSPLLNTPNCVTDYLSCCCFVLERAVGTARVVDAGSWCEAVRNLTVFAEQTHLVQMLDGLEGAENQDFDVLARLYGLLLHRLPGIVTSKASILSLPYLNTLAFTPSFLTKTWKWLAINLQVPLEAPLNATRGWTVNSVKTGFASLNNPKHAHVLALFCQAYSHLLLVLDDDDFHERQTPLNLGQNRAVSATLNTLVFYTHCPVNGSIGSCQTVEKEWLGVLEEFVPLLLRRLYERDARRSFCKSVLWLGPYNEGNGGKSNFLAAAVVQALLNKTSGRLKEGEAPSVAVSRVIGLSNLLLCAPQCVPFDQRVEVFRGLIQADKQANRWELSVTEGGPRPVDVTIRRGELFGDAMDQLCRLGPRVKGRLMTTFIDEHGIEEAGLDHGGLMKELIEEVVKAGIDPDAGLFQPNTDGLVYPSPLAEQLPHGRQMLQFLGQMLGKALYEGLLIDIPLAPFFLLKLQGRTLMFDDLSSLDPELHRNLLQVKHYDGDASYLGLDFTVEADLLGKRVVECLVPEGSEMPVTNENKLQYVHLMADWHVNVKVGRPAVAFAQGMSQIIPLPWLRLFSPNELNALLNGGDGIDIDVEDLKAHTTYSGGYSETSSTVRLFWRTLSSFSPEDRAALMKFITSCSRPPLGGFKHLQPPLTIHKVDCSASPLAALGGKDVDVLPTASTCYNMLKLPNYRRAATLKKKLLMSIKSNSGFGLS